MNDAEITHWLCEATSAADILQRLREVQQLNVKEIAEYADLAPSYVSMLEHDTKHPGRDTLMALLLAGFSLPVSLANRVLLFAGFAPMHYRLLAISSAHVSRDRVQSNEQGIDYSQARHAECPRVLFP